MKDIDNTKEYTDKLKNMKLSESARDKIRSNLQEYAQFHSINEGVRVSNDGRSIKQVPQRTSLLGLRLTYMPIALLLAVFVGGGVTFAAQDAVPGDMLYGIKTEVNENVRSFAAVTANAEAKLQTELLAERLKEATELKGEGKLSGEVGAKMQTAMKSQVEAAAEAASKTEAVTQATTNSMIAALVADYNLLVENDTELAVDINVLNINAATKSSLTTTLALEPVDVSFLANSTKARAEALQSVVVNAGTNISASVQAELQSKLDTALSIVADTSVEVEGEAREKLIEAADLVGEVEAKLTTLGTATIDTNTGAILNIDFGNQPQAEPEKTPDEEVIQPVDSVEDDSSLDIDVDIETDTGVDTDIIDVNLDADVSASSGINL